MKRERFFLTVLFLVVAVGYVMAFNANSFTRYFVYRKISEQTCIFMPNAILDRSGQVTVKGFTTAIYVGGFTSPEVCTLNIEVISEP